MQIANKFNNYFASIGSNLARQIKSPSDKSFKNNLTKKHNHTFKFHDINEDSINSIIVKLSPKTSFGFDGLSTKLIKIIKPLLVRLIGITINQMLNTGLSPDKLKIAKTNRIFKKDDNTLFTNYRPISLLPAISKIFEKVIFHQVHHYFQVVLFSLLENIIYCFPYSFFNIACCWQFYYKFKHFYNAQYGFRTEHSIEFAAIELVDRIILNMDKKDTPAGIFLDLSKAFATLDHDILLCKLKFYDFWTSALNLMKTI